MNLFSIVFTFGPTLAIQSIVHNNFFRQYCRSRLTGKRYVFQVTRPTQPEPKYIYFLIFFFPKSHFSHLYKGKVSF